MIVVVLCFHALFSFKHIHQYNDDPALGIVHVHLQCTTVHGSLRVDIPLQFSLIYFRLMARWYYKTNSS